MKVKLAFGNILMRGFKTPNICCSCAKNPLSNHDELLCLNKEGRMLYTNKFKFPYCYSCYEKLKKTLFKDRVRSVQVSNVKKAKYGSFLRKKTLRYIEFDFKNDPYAELFQQANQNGLFDKVLAELQAKEG